MELVVLVASFKYFFVEGGEQFIIGLQTSKKIGKRPIAKITLFGFALAAILYFTFYFTRTLIPTNILEILLGVGLLYFSFSMFKEAFEGEEKDTKTYRYGYTSIVILESVENSAALAALTFVDLIGAIVGALAAAGILVSLALKSSLFDKVSISKLRLISGTLLTITAIPLLIYGFGLPSPEWVHWIIPPLEHA